MTNEVDVLARNVQALKELLRAAWRELASPELPVVEQRETRHQIKQSSAELRRHLQLLESERGRAQAQATEGARRGSKTTTPRLVSG